MEILSKKKILDMLFKPLDVNNSELGLGFHVDNSCAYCTGCVCGYGGEIPPTTIFSSVEFWPAQSVVARDGIIALDSFMDQHRHDLLKKLGWLRNYPVLDRSNWATSIECVYPAQNYFHFIVDVLPKVWLLHNPYFREKVINLYVTKEISGQKELLLRALLPGNIRIRRVFRFSRVRAENYIYLPCLSVDRHGVNPGRIETSAGYWPKCYLNWFRSKMLEDNEFKSKIADSAHRKIYISRARARTRRFKNEPEVRRYLENAGFETVFLEDMNFYEQARLFSEAEVVVSQHGAGLTNIIYMNTGSVIEIFSSKEVYVYYQQCAKMIGLNYDKICLDGGWKNKDVYMPIELLDGKLRNISRY
ncbi:MAG: hypothetical protein KatS3mg042_0597 [Rhodothermaceae bacterium]|nr:MAG: hypothetical protein KatS3mg042_0597 [Rhodothermaceae bacterium]